MNKKKSVLICHENDKLNRFGLAGWLANFTHLNGIIVLRETNQRLFTRIQREIKRVGWIRFIDVLCMRLYYKIFIAEKDKKWESSLLERLKQRYPQNDGITEVLMTTSPNTTEAKKFLKEKKPDIIIARCKQLIRKEIYTIPHYGTWVMHPGICPEYRNAHGIFWAIAKKDWNKVGMTLLRIDEGIDTGPVYGYYSYPYDIEQESYIRITHRVVFENLTKLENKFDEIFSNAAKPIDTAGRESKVWGQPWLSQYLSYRFTKNENRG